MNWLAPMNGLFDRRPLHFSVTVDEVMADLDYHGEARVRFDGLDRTLDRAPQRTDRPDPRSRRWWLRFV